MSTPFIKQAVLSGFIASAATWYFLRDEPHKSSFEKFKCSANLKYLRRETEERVGELASLKLRWRQAQALDDCIEKAWALEPECFGKAEIKGMRKIFQSCLLKTVFGLSPELPTGSSLISKRP